jgi:hypothetical protein
MGSGTSATPLSGFRGTDCFTRTPPIKRRPAPRLLTCSAFVPMFVALATTAGSLIEAVVAAEPVDI